MAVLTRGYQAKLSEEQLVIYPNLAKCLYLNKRVQLKNYPGFPGDEVLEMVDAFKEQAIDIIVGSQRYQAARYAERFKTYDVYILDDGKQHLKLKRDLDISVINVNEQGYLREFEKLAQVDYLVLNKFLKDGTEQKKYLSLKQKYKLKCPQLKIYGLCAQLKVNLPLNTKSILVFSAIADYDSFFKQVKAILAENFEVETEYKAFKDHHYFTESELKSLTCAAEVLICTKKDLVKIPEKYHSNIYVAELELNSLDDPSLFELVAKHISSII